MESESVSRQTTAAPWLQGARVDTPLAFDNSEIFYTLLGVRSDGVASIIDLVAARHQEVFRRHAQALLREHLSCTVVEVWRDGALVDQLMR